MPRKVFTAGEVLAAADVNEFLQDQVIMTFAGTAARGSAIGTATEGMYAHLNDTDTLTYYNGSAWVNRLVNAGVLQVVSTVKTDTFTASTSNTWEDITGLSVSITPSSATSKVLVLCSINGAATNNGVANIQLIRGATAISIGNADGTRPRASTSIDSNGGEPIMAASITFLDSPATTSATTYKLAVNTGDNTGTAYVNRTQGDADNIYSGRYASTITVMEISG
jgi:hypothetical protein